MKATDYTNAINEYIERYGNDYINVSRVLNTANTINSIDNDTIGIYESLMYEPSYYDNFIDLRNCIAKGGIGLNMRSIERMLLVGIELPINIMDMIPSIVTKH